MIDTRQSKRLILDSPVFFILFFLLQVTYICNALSDVMSTFKKNLLIKLYFPLCVALLLLILVGVCFKCLFCVLPTGASHVQYLSLLNGFVVLGVLLLCPWKIMVSSWNFFSIGDQLLRVEE